MRPELQTFAELCEAKLATHDVTRGGEWKSMTVGTLLHRLIGEVGELHDAVYQDNPTSDSVVSECCDVANFAMMIASNVKRAPDGGSDET